MFRDPQLNLYVADVDASVRFYRDLLGFTETFRTPAEGAPAHVELRLGTLTLGLAAPGAALDMHGITVGGEGPPRGELVLWCDDVDAEVAHLVEAGVPVLSEPHDFLGHNRAAWVADPDGNPVQVVAHVGN